MNEEQIKIEMDKSIKEVFNTDEIISFQFDLVQKALLKGLDLGMKIQKEFKSVHEIHYPKENPDDLPSENKQYLCNVKSAIGGLVYYKCLTWNTESHEWKDDHGKLIPDEIISWSEINQ